MEARIGGAHGKAWTQSRFDMACQEVADPLDWLFNISPPAGAEIDLIESVYAQTQDERTHHPFFGNSSAPYRYTDALASEKHINKV